MAKHFMTVSLHFGYFTIKFKRRRKIANRSGIIDQAPFDDDIMKNMEMKRWRFSMKHYLEEIKAQIREAEFVLVGIGEEFKAVPGAEERIARSYECLEKLLKGKLYFLVTQNEDECIFSSPLQDFFIAAPFGPRERSQSSEDQWNSYLNWLSGTLGHRLCILELGVGFSAPQVIRWPFEKTAQFHLKSFMIRINEKFPQLSCEIKERGISMQKNAVDWLMEAEQG